MKFFTGLLWAVCAVTLYLLTYQYPELYRRVEDPRLQEFYPATVIGKEQVDICSGFTCYTANELKLVLTDNTFFRAHVTDSKFDEAAVNSTILLERHLTDPTVIERRDFRMNLIFVWVFSFFLSIVMTALCLVRRRLS